MRAGDAGADAGALLHPAVLHHVANTLGWPGLRPLQEAAVEPLLAGEDALLLAPTAGGKTEAALFPLLSAMHEQQWAGTSVLYVCPLKALLNNLAPRVHGYAQWLGRSAAVWHGDVGAGERRRIRRERPDVLLTTPESLEAMLVSTSLSPHEHFAHLRVVIVDELHAFAGDDRGWHLLAVLERLARLAGRPLQRVGLSATVGNPDALLAWLQGGAVDRPARVVNPGAAATISNVDVTLDHVGTVDNAAHVIASLHQGEKRLVFAESRAEVEALGTGLRERGVETYLSHSSLSRDERARAETAFASGRDCVIVATSTLELGVDVGDLDRVVQVGAPRTVASFLQRLGRTGRRPGTTRNALFLATRTETLLRAAGLLRLWGGGHVEPVVPPPEPRHVAAQQLLALVLQQRAVGDADWRHWWGRLPLMDEEADGLLDHLRAEGYLSDDAGLLQVGPEAERRYGRRHFLELLAVFTAAPEFLVLAGREELGSVDVEILTKRVEGPRILSLGGRGWLVSYVDWRRRRVFVEPSDLRGTAKWSSSPAPLSFELCQAMRHVLLGGDPPVTLTRRAERALGVLRQERHEEVAQEALVVRREGTDLVWWTWAGARANATLAAAAPDAVDPGARPDNFAIRLRSDVEPHALAATLERADLGARPAMTDDAVQQLKLGEVLPRALAHQTLAARATDPEGAAATLLMPRQHLRT